MGGREREQLTFQSRKLAKERVTDRLAELGYGRASSSIVLCLFSLRNKAVSSKSGSGAEIFENLGRRGKGLK